jgi:predicted amidohydrolase YtcJ
MVDRECRSLSPLVLLNGDIHTMDESNPVAQAILLESGRVRKVGRNEEFSNTGSAERLDLEGMTVFPGFIDSHVHLLSYGLSLDEVDLTEARSIADVLGMLREERPRGAVVRASQLDPDSLAEKRYPRRSELDSVFGKVPAFIKRRDEHSSVVNTAALELLSLSPETPGICTDPSTGEPSGVLKMQANQFALETFHGMIEPEEMKEAYARAARAALEYGVTSIHSLIGSDENPARRDCEILLEIMDELPARVIPYYQTKDVEKVLELGLERIGGCILIDGSIGSRTAAFESEYADDPGNRGCLYIGEDELLSFFESAEENGLQIAVHAIGDRAVERALSSYEKLMAKYGIRDHRHRIEHAEYVTEGQFERIADSGICLGMQPAFEGFWGGDGRMYDRRLGRERAGKLNALARAVSYGIRVAGGSDAPITPPDPIYGIYCAVNHPSEESRVTLPEAVKMFTSNGALVAHKEGEIGSLRAGCCADLVGVSPDPFSAKKEDLNETKVVLVVQNGEVVLRRERTDGREAGHVQKDSLLR